MPGVHEGGPPVSLLRWASEAVGTTATRQVTSLAQSGTGGPWRLDVTVGGAERSLVLKAERPRDEAQRRFATAAAALDLAAAEDVPAPRAVAHDTTAASGWLASLTTLLPGTSAIPREISAARLRELGRAAAHLHLVRGAPTTELPLRTTSLEGYELNAARPVTASTPLFARVRELIAGSSPSPAEPLGFVHGDLWQGNTMWDGDRYAGAIDWDFAGFGPAGIDLGSLRADVAVLHGVEAATEVLAGWEDATGSPAPNVAWWDLVAGLASPEDMAEWVPNFQAQGRTDLDVPTTTRRRDAFLEQALREFCGA